MSFKLSETSSNIIDELTKKLGLPNRSGVLKLAFAKGIKNIPIPLPPQEDAKGREIPLDVVQNEIFDAIIRQELQISNLGKDIKRTYKIIIDFGAKVLKQEYESEIESFLIRLAKESTSGFFRYRRVKSKDENDLNLEIKGSKDIITLELGVDEKGNLITEFWNNKEHTGQHIGVTGKTGAGKTQFVLELLSQIKEKSNNKANVIFFDYAKGDVAANDEFINIIDANVIDIVRDGVPFNPFYLDKVNDQKIEELKEIFTSVQKNLGPKQSLELFDILKECYSLTNEPDLSFVYDTMNRVYEEKGKSKDVLVELFHKLEIPKIFPSAAKEGLYRTLCDKSLVFDLHNLDSHMKVKELVAFLILNKIYTEAIRLPDSSIDPDKNTKEIRTVVVIDEAHNYLNCKNKVLEKMLRELRSKGVVVILLTQGFCDFEQKEFDYSSMLNWIFLMKSDNSKQDIEKALAVNREKAGMLYTQISTAPTGVVYTRKLRDIDKDYTTFKSKAFWERIN